MIPTSTKPCACSAPTAWCGNQDSEQLRRRYRKQYPDLNPDFIFAFPAYNVRSTEINAVLGRSQLKRLDQNNERRRANLRLFLDHLDPEKYRTDFEVEGSCNYAFTLILKRPDPAFSATGSSTGCARPKSSSGAAPRAAATSSASPMSASCSATAPLRTTPRWTTSTFTAIISATTRSWSGARSWPCAPCSTSSGEAAIGQRMNRQLDVLFVSPDSSFQAYQALSKDFSAIEPPTWALLLAQSCRAKGFGVGILDCGAERLSVEALRQAHRGSQSPPGLPGRLWPEPEFRHDQHDRRHRPLPVAQAATSRLPHLLRRLPHQRPAPRSARPGLR